ncbi:beta-ketoacyl-[acyl-carrier-protein] synthase family protein [Streptomyces sp. NPDC023723]|uniref:beta-ketoacyl-[acyl-carrier-protein] synthase family protein n=1 Tax=Streptomyces sp. NPDC023723 TaxID=3154323 RepID=UPI0034090C40
MSAVVTGVGAVAPVGSRAEDVHQALLAGRSGVGLLAEPDFAPLPTRLAGRADIAGRLDRVTARTLERVQQLALVAAEEAWEQAKADTVEPERLAVVIGTAIGGARAIPGQATVLREEGPRRINPYLMTLLMPNACAGTVALRLGARGGAHTPVSACASGTEAIAVALDLIRLGRADVVVAGGAESCLHPMTLAGFAQLRALSCRMDDPEAASRPFDADRDGFVLGEGAGMLVLERPEHAEARGARALGTLLGAAVTSDAHHIMAPDPEGTGAARCVADALRDAGLTPGDIGHVNSHGTATPVGDLAESRALRQVFGGHQPAVTATKSCTGHLLGASGAVEAVATVLALRDGLVPPVRNLTRTGDGIDLDLVRHRPRQVGRPTALSTSIGFGGHNTALVLTR